MKAVFVAMSAAFVLTGCGATRNDDLADGVLELPAALREVSAITVAADGRLACLQDELGVVHFVDPSGQREVETVPFGERGDYEGLARVGDDYWVLRSDGYLARITSAPGGWHISASLRLPAGPQEWESLCFDAASDRLLTVPKDGDGAAGRGQQWPVWAVDPRTLQVSVEPLLTLRRSQLIDAAEAEGLALPRRDKGKKRPVLALNCTEVAVVPGSGDLLVLSAADGMLLQIDRGGRLRGASLLDRELLPQPEGMTFLADGRLLIATEGRDGPGRAVVVALP